MEEAELDKSEAATPFKLNRARERGAVARGIDLGFFAVLAAFLGYVWTSGESAAARIAHASGAAFASAGNGADGAGVLLVQMGRLFETALWPLVVLGGVVFAVALLLEFVQVGPVFSLQPLKPDFGRINPAKGLQRLFAWRLLVEAAKSVFKLAIYGAIGWFVITAAIQEESDSLTNGARLLEAIEAFSVRLLLICVLAAFCVAVVDQLYARREFGKKMRMSRRELKREYKDREGDSRFRQKRKEYHNEFVKMARSLRNVRGADVIVTNPIHYAVALRYDRGVMEAPMIVARGAGHFAERIKKIGSAYGVVIVTDVSLARSLYRTRLLEAEIPETFYGEVADIYRQCKLASDAA